MYEISQVLKAMKNNKTPGINGIPTDFLKVFLAQIEIFYIIQYIFYIIQNPLIVVLEKENCLTACCQAVVFPKTIKIGNL